MNSKYASRRSSITRKGDMPEQKYENLKHIVNEINE